MRNQNYASKFDFNKAKKMRLKFNYLNIGSAMLQVVNNHTVFIDF